MQSGISFLSVLRVMTIGANTGAAHNHQRIENVTSHHITYGNIRASFEGRRYTDRQFRGRSAECNNGKSDHDGRDAKTLGYRGGTVC